MQIVERLWQHACEIVLKFAMSIVRRYSHAWQQISTCGFQDVVMLPSCSSLYTTFFSNCNRSYGLWFGCMSKIVFAVCNGDTSCKIFMLQHILCLVAV